MAYGLVHKMHELLLLWSNMEKAYLAIGLATIRTRWLARPEPKVVKENWGLVWFVFFHHSIFFTLFVGSIPITQCNIFFFFLVPKLTEPSEKKKKKKKPRIEPVKERRRRRKIKNKITEQPTRRRKEKKKSKVVKSCGWVLFVGPLCVFNYNITIELWVMETENSQNVFSVSITHNSKIR